MVDHLFTSLPFELGSQRLSNELVSFFKDMLDKLKVMRHILPPLIHEHTPSESESKSHHLNVSAINSKENSQVWPEWRRCYGTVIDVFK